MREVTLPDGTKVPALGQGTWRMGEQASRAADEIAALREGIALGMTLIDTAEMYGDGGSETMLSEVLKGGVRDGVYLVSKAYPQNASRGRLERACEASLKRLGTDRLDMYLLHWRGGTPLDETVEGMEALRRAGKIRHWGVSNFDADDMDELFEAGGEGCATNQVLYNLARRGPEFDLAPELKARSIPLMAYSPVEQGRLPKTGALASVAQRHGVSPLQIALAWVLRSPDVIAIPKATSLAHVKENRAALDLRLTAEDLAELDGQFPPPQRKRPLEMI